MGLETATFLAVDVVVHRVNTAVAEDWEILAEADFGNFDAGEKVGFLSAVEETREGGQNRVVVIGIVPELGYCLRDEHIEPVERFWLVRIDVVICFGQYSSGRETRRGTEHM